MKTHLDGLRWMLVIATLGAFSLASAEAIREIKDASAQARIALAAATEQAPGALPASSVSTVRLEAALKRGEEINASLQSEVESLKTERAQLVQIQTALTSGLIGAVVTVFVAIGGAIINSRSSKPERDLKRLAVLEKAHELQTAGVPLPDDIAQAYAIKPGVC